jgi:hypothetical protein
LNKNFYWSKSQNARDKSFWYTSKYINFFNFLLEYVVFFCFFINENWLSNIFKMYDERKRNDIKALYEEYGSLNTVAIFWGVTQPNCNIFCWHFFYILVTVRGTSLALVDIRISGYCLSQPLISLKIDVEELVFLN